MDIPCTAHRKPACTADACARRRRRFESAAGVDADVIAANLAPFDSDSVNLSDYDFGAYDSTMWGSSGGTSSGSSYSDSGSSSTSCDSGPSCD